MSNRDWWPITNILKLKDSNAKANGDVKPFKLIVEGRIDNFFYSRVVSGNTEVISVGGTIRPKPSNVKNAIVGFMEEVKNRVIRFEVIKPFGVVDSDYLNPEQDTCNLVHTDTNDLETLLLSTNAFDISYYPNMDERTKKSIECISYQFGLVRKAILKYIEQKHCNIRDFIDEEWLKKSLNLFCDLNDGFDISKMINAFKNEKNNKALYKNDMTCELLRAFIFAQLRQSNELDEANQLIHSPLSFDKNTISNYWEQIRGHDVSYLANYFLPSLSQDIQSSYGLSNLDSFIAMRSDPTRIRNTKLFKAFQNWGIAC